MLKKILSCVLALSITLTAAFGDLSPKAAAAENDDFQTMFDRCYEQTIGISQNGSFDMTDSAIKQFVEKVDSDSQSYWTSMIKSEQTGREQIFPGIKPNLSLSDNAASADLTTTYKYLNKLAQAYCTPGTALYQNKTVAEEVLSAIDFTIDNAWFGSKTYDPYGNWWDHRIGVPAQLAPILVVLRDDISEVRFAKYTTAMKNQKNDDWGTYDAANLSDISLNAMYIAILTEDNSLLSRIKEKLGATMFSYTTSSNGWYPDGSYVDHGTMAYTGGYGSVLISAMEKMMPLVKGTAYEMTYGDERDDFYNTVIFTGYLPLLPNGRIVEMVSGRSITRKPNENRNSAGQMAVFSDALDAEESLACKSLVKGWLETDPTILARLTKPAELMACKKILDDDTIVAAQPENGYYRYTNMDKVAQRTENYLVGLSMHSNRIVNCENINTEGQRLWNVSDGALYLYDADTQQYMNDYWPTVDQLRLTGTTTLYDTSRTNTAGFNTKNPNDWVGGTDMGDIGVAGMEINTIGTGNSRNGVHAQKSYFFFDDEIVALGSDINSTIDKPAQTVVENKRIQDDISNAFTFNGEEVNIVKVTDTKKYLQVRSNAKLSKVHQVERDLPQDAKTIQATVKMRFADSQQGAALRFYGLDDSGKSVLIATAELRDSGSDKGVRMWGQTGSPYIYQVTNRNEWVTIDCNLDLENQKITFNVTNEAGQDITARSEFVLMGGGVHIAKPSKIAFYNMNTLTPECVEVAGISLGADGAAAFESIDFNTVTAGALLNMSGWRAARVDSTGKVIDTNLESNFKVSTQSYQTAGTDTQINDVTWAHLQGNVEGSDVGYYFPDATTVKALKETRTGTWEAINPLKNWGHSELPAATRGYATMYIDHGNKPTAADYEYVMLPGMSGDQTKSYSENPDIKIVENSNDAHAVRETKLGVLGANFWTTGEYTADKITSSTRASVMLKETDSTYEISLTDPTGKNTSGIQLTFALPTNAVLTKSDAITVVSMNENGCTIQVDTSKAELGEKFTASFRKEALNTDSLTSKVADAKKLTSDVYTAGSFAALQTAINAAEAAIADAKTQAEIDTALVNLEAAVTNLVNISELKATFTKFMLISNTTATYTKGSFAAFDAARTAANTVLNNANATKANVAEALANLNNSKTALVNISTLKMVIDLAQGHIDAGDVDKLVPSAKKQFNDTFTAVNNVYKNENATEAQVDAAWKTMMSVIHGLGFVPGDAAELTALVAKAQALDLDAYLDGAEKDTFTAALAAAVALLADEDAMQADFDYAVRELQDAMDALLPAPVVGDKSELQKVYDEALSYDLSKYVDDAAAKAAFEKAKTDAKAMLDKEDAKQGEIDAEVLNLLNAMAGLRLRADKSSLNEWLEDLKAIDLSQYTAESANAVRTAIMEAEALAAQDLGEEQAGLIQAAVARMEAAYKGLQLAEQQPEQPGDNESSSSEKEEDASQNPGEENSGSGSSETTGKPSGTTPTTGDAAPIAVVSLLVAAAGALMLLKKKRS